MAEPVSNYATLEELRGQVGAQSTTEDPRLQLALATASRVVDQICGRRFWLDTTATARLYAPPGTGDPRFGCSMLWVDDIATTDNLAVATDGAGDGSYSTVWAGTDYELWPLSGVVGGVAGWPYEAIRAVGMYTFPGPWYPRSMTVQVTAKWGWAEVPTPVKTATIITAAEIWKTKDAPFGVAGVSGIDGLVIRVRQNPMVAALLAPYDRGPVIA